MGLFSRLLTRRAKNKAMYKAAKQHAKSEVREGTKLALRQQKLLTKERKLLEKQHHKNLKAKQKHNERMAKATYKQLKAGSFNAQTVRRYTGAARLLAPLLLPLAYRGITWAREQLVKQEASRHGVSADKLAQYSGLGAPLKARIEQLRETVNNAPLPSGFQRDIDSRLDKLIAATNNADSMGTTQRNRIHQAISEDLETVTGDVHRKLEEDRYPHQ
ncbi:DUF6474 family protein [Corynebacterium choanae]|nr:DUF6474 family protein [Corynebacterium choanae]